MRFSCFCFGPIVPRRFSCRPFSQGHASVMPQTIREFVEYLMSGSSRFFAALRGGGCWERCRHLFLERRGGLERPSSTHEDLPRKHARHFNFLVFAQFSIGGMITMSPRLLYTTPSSPERRTGWISGPCAQNFRRKMRAALSSIGYFTPAVT